MTHHDSTRTQKLHSIRRRLALGVAIPSLLVFSFSAQAQTSSFSTFTKTASTNKDLGKGKVRSPSTSKSRSMVAKPSSGIRSSVSKKPNKIEERVSRSKSIGLPGMQSTKEGSGSSLNRSSRNLRPGTTVGESVRGGSHHGAPVRQDGCEHENDVRHRNDRADGNAPVPCASAKVHHPPAESA